MGRSRPLPVIKGTGKRTSRLTAAFRNDNVQVTTQTGQSHIAENGATALLDPPKTAV